MIEHKKIKTYDVGNPGPCLRQAHKVAGFWDNKQFTIKIWFSIDAYLMYRYSLLIKVLYNVYFSRFMYIMPTLLKTYSNNQPNPVLITALQFVCKTFYILHRKPFILQVGISCFIFMSLPRGNSGI